MHVKYYCQLGPLLVAFISLWSFPQVLYFYLISFPFCTLNASLKLSQHWRWISWTSTTNKMVIFSWLKCCHWFFPQTYCPLVSDDITLPEACLVWPLTRLTLRLGGRIWWNMRCNEAVVSANGGSRCEKASRLPQPLLHSSLWTWKHLAFQQRP